ncbi:MAG TPA: thiopeptide-type bacteriocin biosynthesis protein [Bryobacteraceae bacterium]|nr:thiopeptide-type bacteriocin biosynthesis protein [Bryobacteraceae bacterium]
MKTVVFLGPTLPVETAKSYVEAEFLPPVQQGDILRILKSRPDAIGIIDGYFQSVPSVWHKEILTALAEGVHVAGAASMGALRAAELAHFGMTGIGQVFEKFRSGEYTDDDEVAVVHAPAEQGFRAVSEAMVNIRDLCAEAAHQSAISQSEAEALVRIAKALHFSQRQWEAILAQAQEQGLPRSLADRVRAFRARFPQGIKERDGIALLQHLAALAEKPQERIPGNLRVEQTVFLADLKREVEREAAPDLEEAPGTPLNVARKKVLLGILASREVVRRGLIIGSDDVGAMTDWFRGMYALEGADRFESWKAKHTLGEPEFAYAMRRFTEVVRLEEDYSPQIDQELDNYLRVYSAASQNQGETAEWVQLNVTLGRGADGAAASARMLFSELAATLPRLQKKGILEQFHFVRKSPDLRLRFQAVAPDEYLLPCLHELFTKQQQCGAVVSVYRSVYEPEARMFGGPEAMDVVHEYFHQDSVHWARWDQIPVEERTLSAEQFCTAVLNDLFARALGCGAEVWDAWQNLGELTRECKPLGGIPATGGEVLAEVARAVGPEERAVLKRYAKASQQFAGAIRQVWAGGRLSIGMRSLLPMLAMFHFNRFGLDGGRQASLAKLAACAWDPYQEIAEKPQARTAVGQVRAGSRASQP